MSFVQKILLILLLFILAGVVSCNSSRSPGDGANNENKKNEMPKPPIPPPPGQADVKAIVKNYSENKAGIIATIEINDVLRYGASTPPLAQGSKIRILVPKHLSGDQKGEFKKKEILLMRISFDHGMDNKGSWKLVSFINK